MNQYNLSGNLLESKVRDYQLNSAIMPKKARILSKLFAKSLGNSAGRIISIYHNMYSQIQDNQSVEETKESVRRDVNKKSKVYINVPFLKPRQARICGLVAMNYSGFFDSEVEIYSALMKDLQRGTSPIEDIVKQSKQAVVANPKRYGILLQQKQQAIYDFGVLMGIVDDNERFDMLKKGMPERIVKYFDMVVSMHKGGRLGISWPLPLKKFSESIRNGFYRDTIANAVQEGVGNNYGFVCPEEGAYDLVVKQIKEAVQEISSKKNTIAKKWKMAYSLPITLFFLSGINAYTDENTEVVRKALKSDFVEAGLTAGTSAGISASITADDVDDFVTTFATSWLLSFKTSI